ncbi:hypothetical protein HanRHA438_Chr07g0306041 [Helianthus annuus]|nr:hypothetical protein HanRHA438_Chr07g0306041 [Helianthus annuus]
MMFIEFVMNFQEKPFKPNRNCIFSTKIECFMNFSVSKVDAAFSGRICIPLRMA